MRPRGAPPPVPPPQATAATPKEAAPLALPARLQGKAVVVPRGDRSEARADSASAVKPAERADSGAGIVVRLIADVPVWRMWNGPAKKDAGGRTNRLGQWWATMRRTEQRTGTSDQIQRVDHFTNAARCTLKKGAVVAIGPGNSVSLAQDLQRRGRQGGLPRRSERLAGVDSQGLGPPMEPDRPPQMADYQADSADIARPKPAAGR